MESFPFCCKMFGEVYTGMPYFFYLPQGRMNYLMNHQHHRTFQKGVQTQDKVHVESSRGGLPFVAFWPLSA